MTDSPFELPASSDVFDASDKQRRLDLIRGVLPLFIGLDMVGIAIFTIYSLYMYSINSPAAPQPLLISLLALGIAVLVFFFAWAVVETNRPHVNVDLATNLTCLGTTGTVIITEISWYITQGLDSQLFVLLTTFGVAIVLAGMLNGKATLIITTLVLNGVTTGIITHALLTAKGDANFTREGLLLIGSTLLHQWAFTILLLIVQGNYRRLIEKLGNERFARQRAEKFDELKDQFIHNVNHELRNPIMVLLAYHEALKTLAPAEASAAYLKYLDKVSDTGLSLRNLVQRVLDLSMLDQSTPTFIPQPVPLRATIVAATTMIDPQDMNRSLDLLTIQVSDDLVVWGDMVLLQQIVVNLLSNAVKYSAATMPIQIIADTLTTGISKKGQRPQPSHVQLRIRDYGAGIPPDQASLLFHRFVRLPRDLTSSVHGSGLGLYISRVLAREMGGDITVSSSGVAGEGATFYLTLPLPPQSA